MLKSPAAEAFNLSGDLEVPPFEGDRIFDYCDPFRSVCFLLAAICQGLNVRTLCFPSFAESISAARVSEECGIAVLHVAAMTFAHATQWCEQGRLVQCIRFSIVNR